MDPVDPFFSKFLAVSPDETWVPWNSFEANFFLSRLYSVHDIDHVRRDQASPSFGRQAKMAITSDTAVLGHASRRKTESIYRSGMRSTAHFHRST